MFSVLIDQFWSLTIAGIALGFIYVLISLGYTMVYGVLRMINFANSEIFMWGTFGTVVTNRDIFHYTQTSEPAHGFKLALVLITSLLMSMLVAGLTAVFVEFVAYRRLRMKGTNRLATLISAIGISIALQEVMRLLTSSRPVGSPRVLEKIILTEVWGANIRLDTENSVTVVEWGGAESARLSEDRLEISIDRTNEIRQVEIKAIGSRWDGFAI